MEFEFLPTPTPFVGYSTMSTGIEGGITCDMVSEQYMTFLTAANHDNILNVFLSIAVGAYVVLRLLARFGIVSTHEQAIQAHAVFGELEERQYRYDDEK
jgi:hypothetical protein